MSYYSYNFICIIIIVLVIIIIIININLFLKVFLRSSLSTFFSNVGNIFILPAARVIGFRTVALVQEPLQGPDGHSFYFTVNGVKIWAKVHDLERGREE